MQPAFTEQGLVRAAWPLRISWASRSVDASYKEMSSWGRAKLLIRCLKLSPGTPEYVEAQQKSTLCRVLLDLKRSSEWKARCVLQARRQPSTHRRTSEYSPHRCGVPNQSPLSPCSSCTRCCVTRPFATRVLCLPCACTKRPEYRPKYETRNERVPKPEPL